MNIDDFVYDPRYDTLPCDTETAKNILAQAISNTFVDREVSLLNNIMYFIFGSSNYNSEKPETLATQYFHSIWEAICSELFNNEYDHFKYLIPKPKWHVYNNKYNPYNFSRQIPDILYYENNTLYVLDAKYYNIKRNLPGWHDLVKQFYYAYSLGISLNVKTRNLLLFPGLTDHIVEYFGYVDIENDKRLGEVEAYLIDIAYAIKSYGLYRKQSLRNYIGL